MNHEQNKRSPIVGAVIIIIAIGLIATYSSLFSGVGSQRTIKEDSQENRSDTVQSQQETAVTYQGEDGKTALELLKKSHQIDATPEGFVNSIDGKAAGKGQFWAFYVNGKAADVGAKDYQTKSSDRIEWKLESF